MARILYDARWIGQHGIGRFADELAKSLPGLREFRRARRPWHPLDPALLGLELWHAKPRLFFSPGYNSPLAWPRPFVFTLHDLHHLRVPENSNAIKRAYYHQVIRPACHRATFVLTVSEYSKREIAAWAGLDSAKIVNVGNGVGLPFSPHGSCYQPGFPYLLYVGSHKPHKNLPRLLSAYAAAGVCNDVSFVLTGYPSAELQSQVKALRIQEHVRFVRIVDNDSLAQLYRGAAGLLFPSLYEGFGLPPLEAMACGTPVMTSNVCSLPEVVGDSAVLINPLDIDAIAAGIRKLVMDSELRLMLRSKGFAQARRFTWQQTALATQQVLEAALAQNGPEV